MSMHEQMHVHGGCSVRYSFAPDGGPGSFVGFVESADGRTLTMSWNSGSKGTFKKTDRQKIPDEPSVG